jgi:hypothetical protein
MANLIQIKRSATTATPPALAVGELAYSSNSNNLFIGEAGAVVTKIGGKDTANKADAALPAASFTDAAVTSKLISGFVSGSGSVAAADTILGAINKLDGNIALRLPSGSFTDTAVTGKVLTGYSPAAGTVAATDTILGAINKLNGNDGLSLPTASFTDAAVTSKVITGYVSGAGTVAATDTVLAAINKLDGNNALRLPTASFTDAAVVGKALSGFVSTTGVVSAADTIISAISKLAGNVAAAGSGTLTAVDVTTANGVSGTSSGGTTPSLTISLGAITPTTVNGLTLTPVAAGITLMGGTVSKTMTFPNTLTISGTDTSTLNVGTGGTLGTAAYTASTAYATAAQGTLATNALPTASFTNAQVVGKLIAGYASGAGTVAASDSILGAINKLNGNDVANLAAAKTYADGLVVGLWDDRGNYDASVNTFPAAGGSGSAGAVLKGDIWTISIAGTLGGVPMTVRQTIRAMVDAPAQVAANWAIGLANTDVDDSITDGVIGRAPSQNAVFDALALKANLTSPTLVTPVLGVASASSINNVAITAPAAGATLTIANGATLTASATATVSGSNTGDNATNTQYSGLVTNATHTGDVTGATALTIATGAVTLAKMANMATASFLGRTTAAVGVPEVLSATAARAILNVANGATANVGTVTSVTAGNGLALTGTGTINPTLTVGSHAGSAGTIGTITVGAGTVGVSLGSTSTTAAAGNDARLSDARAPTNHNQAWSTITTTPTTLAGYGISDALSQTAAIDGGTF